MHILNFEYLGKIEPKVEIILTFLSRDHMGSNHDKNRGQTRKEMRIKGSVQREFRPLVYFLRNSNLQRPLTDGLKYFRYLGIIPKDLKINLVGLSL